MTSTASAASSPAASQKLFTYKLVLLGEMSVGKSSLVLQFVKGFFDPKHETTIGAAYLTQTIPLDDGTVKFEIWDTAGQERYHSLAPMYYRGANAAIIVYDVTSPDSLGRAKAWVKELQSIQRQPSSNLVIALAGNKCDLRENSRVSVSKEAVATYAEENDLLFMETSAKNGDNVSELFYSIARKLPKSSSRTAGGAVESPASKVQLTASEADRAKATNGGNTGCC